MKKKVFFILSIAISLTLAFSIVVSAATYTSQIDLVRNSSEIMDGNDYVGAIGYYGEASLSYNSNTRKISTSIYENLCEGSVSFNLRVNMQLTITYSANDYDQYYYAGSNHYAYIAEDLLYYSTNGKTVSYIDVEYHIFMNDEYVTTVQMVVYNG